ncbi:uncharacterized protein EI97DRAFT_13395 [Westerdykella ornata]|uniref:Complex 1 LYR protein domain-containing protein n=1 Tax=Westerdykella ornata TaxID=318751 RepID=A0A6A6JWX9_WESOR|nr:uncharacterized protein EI97DRAFT_13395 [Westerdykella ornata]KAF2280917.1 hypothetical protein EI97DRAFT_13395 [Westerdykella ornata]
MARLSGLQRDVLALYRECLRAVREKPVNSQSHFRDFARDEFRKHLSVNKKDFATIEYLLRSGRRKLDRYRDPEIRDIHR